MRPALLLTLLVGLVACSPKQSIKPLVTGLEGKPMPSINLLLPDSTTYVNTVQLAGQRPALLCYFSPNCPYCRVQMRSMVRQIKDFGNSTIFIMTVGSFTDMKHFYKKYELDKYPNIITGLDTGYVMANYYKTKNVPYIAVYNQQHIMAAAFKGRVSPAVLNSWALK